MNKVIFTVGLPASGKSTWAKEYCSDEANNAVRVNMDELRRMRGTYWIPEQEPMIASWQYLLVKEALEYGKDVVVDATNLKRSRSEQLMRRLNEDGISAEMVEKVFDVDPVTCIARDSNRSERVGAEVIWRMYTGANPLWHETKITGYELAGKRDAYIFDIDGTLALNQGRSPYDWNRVGEDKLNEPVSKMLLTLAKTGAYIVLLSGRDSCCRTETLAWLKSNHVTYDALFMRPENDRRKDSIVKQELYYKYVAPYYRVLTVFDDRNQVVDMWRNHLGLPCFQVAEGNF